MCEANQHVIQTQLSRDVAGKRLSAAVLGDGQSLGWAVFSLLSYCRQRRQLARKALHLMPPENREQVPPEAMQASIIWQDWQLQHPGQNSCFTSSPPS